MSSGVLAERELVRGAARFKDLVYVLTKGKELLANEVAHTSVIGLDKGDWAKAGTVQWNSTALAVAKKPKDTLVFIGEDGQANAYIDQKLVEESLTPKPTLIRNARTIDGDIYACGMKRQVYHRSGTGKWKDISASKPTPKSTTGFEAIDGFSSKEIYTAGWSGEIWKYNGKEWIQSNSPVKTILTAVCCTPDDEVFIAGQKGVLLKGKKDSFEKVKLKKSVTGDIWDLCWYENQLYVAMDQGLFTLEGNKLEPVDFGDNEPSSFFNLTTAEGILWSIGPNDILSFDGDEWTAYS